MEKLLLIFALVLPLSVLADSVVPIDKVEQSVNIRMSPDAKSEIVGKLERGSSAEVVSSTDQWHEIGLEGGSTGFISADWTRLVTDSELAEQVEAVIEETIEDVVVPVVAEAAEATVDTELPEAVSAEEILVEQLPDEEPIAVVAPVEELQAEEPPVEEPVETAPEPDDKSVIKLKGKKNYLVKFRDVSKGGTSQVFDDGNRVGIGTDSPKQRLEVNGNIQIHEQNSSVAGLMITQSSGETGYIMHNRASTLTIGAGSIDRITIDRDGNVGIAVARPEHPLEMASGAHVTAGGVFTNSSSRDKKENIVALQADDASAALMSLEPVIFNYRNERDEDYVGFIAEDVPELVAVADRDGLSSMDIVAVLTRVVQEQQNKIKELEARLDAL